MSTPNVRAKIASNEALSNRKKKQRGSIKSEKSSSSGGSNETAGYVSGLVGTIKPESRHAMKERHDAFKLSSMHICGPSEYQGIVHNKDECIYYLKKKFNIKERLLRNLLAYLSQLPKYRSNFIDRNIFHAHMTIRLKMGNNSDAIDKMFKFLQAKNKDILKCLLKKYPSGFESDEHVHVYSYIFFLCKLIANNSDFRAELYFQMNDYYQKGYLTNEDLKYIVPRTQPVDWLNEDDNMMGFSVDFLVQQVTELFGLTDKESRMTCEDFKEKVKKDGMFLDLLGQYVPEKQDILDFLSEIEKLDQFQIQTRFRQERKRLLQLKETDVDFIQSLYPLELEF